MAQQEQGPEEGAQAIPEPNADDGAQNQQDPPAPPPPVQGKLNSIHFGGCLIYINLINNHCICISKIDDDWV